MTYTFRNQFRLQKGQRLDADDPEITLADSADDGFVVLRPAKPETGLISQADELVLRGSGYVDADTAVAAGRKWRQRLTAALAREFIGVDFGPDDQVIPEFDHVYDDDPPAIVQQVGIEGDRVITSDYRLLVFATEPEPKFIEFRMGTPTLKLSGWVDRLRQRIDDVQDDQPWDRQKSLAYRLVYLALTDSNPETQNIQLVTAIEVLLKDQDQPQPILDALDRFLDES